MEAEVVSHSQPSGFELPFISVVVPVYNGRSVISLCIEALLAQDYPTDRREIIVVDNNSTDGTGDIVAGYPVTLLFERDIQTSYAARNRGLLQARGDIVAFTDADCLPRSDWLSQLVTVFLSLDIVGVAGEVKPAQTEGLIGRFFAESNPVRSRKINGLWYVITANAAYRRHTLLELGGFRSELFTAGDIDLSIRLQLGGYGQIEAAPEAVVIHTYGDSWGEIWSRYRRYGYSEVLMIQLLSRQHDTGIPATNQIRVMRKQLRALVTYFLSFLWRLLKLPICGWETEYNFRPLLLIVAESANIWGKLMGFRNNRLWETN